MTPICRSTSTPASVPWHHCRTVVHLWSHHRQRRIEPEHQQSKCSTKPSPRNHLHDSYRRFYQHHRRLALHFGNSCQDRRRRRCHGRNAGCHGHCTFAPPLDDAGNSVKAQLAIKHIMNKLGMNVFNGHRIHVQ